MVRKIWDNPSIYCITVTLPDNPLKNLNSYVISTSSHNLVIDTGFNRKECQSDLWNGITKLNLDLTKTSLFLTHLHSDHTGLVWDFVGKNIPVYMGRIEYDYLSFLGKENGFSEIYLRYFKEGYPQNELNLQQTENQGIIYAPENNFPVIKLEDKEPINLGEINAYALLTSGHTPGHMSLYLPDSQILFSGDHILFDITPNISIWPQITSSLSDYLRNLAYTRSLPVTTVFPAHRSFEGDFSNRIDAIIAHHKKRMSEIKKAVEKTPYSTAFEIASQISWCMRGLSWDEFPQSQKWFAMSEALAHLDYMVQHNLLKRIEKDGFIYYL